MLPEKLALPTTSKGYWGAANPIPTLELNNATPALDNTPVFDSVADVKTPATLKDPLLLALEEMIKLLKAALDPKTFDP
jgi:hypothetical protein